MLPVRDKLRAICHSLKMRSLDVFDENLRADLKSRIEYLPSPEKITEMGKDDLVTLRKNLDNLLYDIDRADNKRSEGYALRHKVDKRLPPSLKPLLASRWYGRYKQGGNNERNSSIRPS